MTPPDTHIRGALRDYIEDNFLYMRPDTELRDDEDLLAAGVIDSLGFLELVQMVQEEFAITIADTEIIEQNFGSIDAMVGFIDRKMNS